jgi:TonB family protein
MPKQFTALPGRFLLRLLLCISLVTTVAVAAVAQKETASNASDSARTVMRKTGSGVTLRTYSEIPAATEQRSADEHEWWERVRKAGSIFQKKDGKESRKNFYLLLYEGQQKGYRIPLKDRPPQVLSFARANYSDLALERKVNGSVELSVEYLADGSVGDVQLVKGVGFGIDKFVIQARRQDSFLPAIKDGAFVDYRTSVTVSFSTRRP